MLELEMPSLHMQQKKSISFDENKNIAPTKNIMTKI